MKLRNGCDVTKPEMNATPVYVNMDNGSSYLRTSCMHDHATGFSHNFSQMNIINYDINFISLVLKVENRWC